MFFKTGKPLAGLMKEERERSHIDKIIKDKGEIIIETEKRGDYFANLYANKLENLYEIGNFLDKYKLPKF